MMIVLPGGDFGYWVNNVDDGPRWGDYLARDLVRHISSAYRSLPRARSRAIGGHSFGGYGALHLAFRFPRVFSVVGAHSPSLRIHDGTLANVVGTDEEFAERDPVRLAQTLPDLEGLQVWLDVGEDDNFRERVEELSANLSERGVDHELHVFPGDHSFEYWADNVVHYLRFYSAALSRQ